MSRTPRTVLRVAGLALALFASAVATPAPAQAQTAAERSLARDRFQEGVAAAREERWQDAVEALQASYDLVPRPLTLLNLAGALMQVGRLVEAAESYRQFLHEDDVPDRQRRDAEEQLAALEPRIPHVRLRVLGLEEADQILLDEYDLSGAALDAEYPVDPGPHVVTISRNEHEPRTIPFESEEGVLSEVLVDARPEAWPAIGTPVDDDVVADEGTTTGTTAGGRSIAEEPAFWLVLGGVVVAAGVGIGLGVALGTPPSPTTGNLYPFRVELQ